MTAANPLAPTKSTLPTASARKLRPGTVTVVIALVLLSWSTLAMEVPVHGWAAGLGLLAGVLSYAFMAIAVMLASRKPVLERWFGPLDRLYRAHRMLAIGTVAGLGLHLLLRNESESARAVPLPPDLLFRPLGVVGAVLLGGSVILALAVKVQYHRWKPVHAVTMAVFALLTAHGLLAASALEPTPLFILAVCTFALPGTVAVAVRLSDKLFAGVRYDVVGVNHGSREVELLLGPAGRRAIDPSTPGQFALLTARVHGRRETHPFTLTNAGGSETLSFAVRSLGDWTEGAQTGIEVGDQVRVEGPFGGFTPAAAHEAPARPQVWVGAGAGITPFVAALRTAAREAEAHAGVEREGVELVIVARDSEDVPCWDDIASAAAKIPWLRITPVFSSEGHRLDAESVERLIARSPGGAEWFLCGPSGLMSTTVGRLRRARVPARAIHREVVDWRGPRWTPTLTSRKR